MRTRRCARTSQTSRWIPTAHAIVVTPPWAADASQLQVRIENLLAFAVREDHLVSVAVWIQACVGDHTIQRHRHSRVRRIGDVRARVRTHGDGAANEARG